MGISIGHILIVTVVVLLFGSKRIPELASSLGRGYKAFKDGINETNEIENEIENKSNKAI